MDLTLSKEGRGPSLTREGGHHHANGGEESDGGEGLSHPHLIGKDGIRPSMNGCSLKGLPEEEDDPQQLVPSERKLHPW